MVCCEVQGGCKRFQRDTAPLSMAKPEGLYWVNRARLAVPSIMQLGGQWGRSRAPGATLTCLKRAVPVATSDQGTAEESLHGLQSRVDVL